MTVTAVVYDRVHLMYPGRNLVIEYVDGYCEYNDTNLDEWRLINLDNGVVEARSTMPHDVLVEASALQSQRFENDELFSQQYVPEQSAKRSWSQLPLADKLRHVESHARDLVHDFELDNDNRCPLAVALKDFEQRYNDSQCFQKSLMSNEWEINVDLE
mgnify:CR=1 FL=1|tara:strand:+ start:410 stop:883 length:474 start_codon:yes stop_codon:yes gene_type:complete